MVWIATCLATGLFAAEPAGSFTIRAEWFDRGNVRVSLPGEIYADQYACIWNGGVLPNTAEYELDFPVTADYTLVALYTAADSRPVDVFLNDVRLFQGFAGVTGELADVPGAVGSAGYLLRNSGQTCVEAAVPRSLPAPHLRAAI